MNENTSLLDSILGGEAIQIDVKIDLESIAILAGSMVVAIIVGNLLSAAILKA